MRQRDLIIEELRARGELWEPARGLVAMRGEPLARFLDIESLIASGCRSQTDDEWRVPAALALSVLERADYFASFPQWLSLATHLSDDPRALETIAAAGPGRASQAAAAAAVPATTALPPAVCYHVYDRLAGSVIDAPRIVTAQGCCWRHEGQQRSALERGWAFTMRELVCVGTESQCAAFRARGVSLAQSIATRLGLRGQLVDAEDPFFAPTARARGLLQRIKGLKQELRLDVGDGETVACASFNLHERFFGEAFDIRLPDGSPAFTACVAFGLERWLLAALVASRVESLEEILR
jgi:seryl-tRNA synthetase